MQGVDCFREEQGIRFIWDTMSSTRVIIGFLLLSLVTGQASAVSLYFCRMDETVHTTCCCTENCSGPEIDCSCCRILQVETQALIATLAPSLDPNAVQAFLLTTFDLGSQASARIAHYPMNAPDRDPPPRPRSLLTVQRI